MSRCLQISYELRNALRGSATLVSHEEANHGDLDEGLARLDLALVVFAHAAIPFRGWQAAPSMKPRDEHAFWKLWGCNTSQANLPTVYETRRL